MVKCVYLCNEREYCVCAGIGYEECPCAHVACVQTVFYVCMCLVWWSVKRERVCVCLWKDMRSVVYNMYVHMVYIHNLYVCV